MKLRLRSVILSFLAVVLILSACPGVSGEEIDIRQAEDISGMGIVTEVSNIWRPERLFDKNKSSCFTTGENASISLEHPEGIGSLYLRRTTAVSGYTVTDNTTGTSAVAGDTLLLHDFTDLTALFGYAPTSITIDFGAAPVTLAELYVFTPGEVPDFVQKWNLPAEGKTDLLLLCAHGDDDQLFFAGILPYYAKELGYTVQVVYLSNHFNNDPYRVHEMLDGLWAVGVDIHPVFGGYADFYATKHDMHSAYRTFLNYKLTKEDLVGFVVEQLRRFKPQVALTHDFKGEYGHAQHMVCADLMAEAINVSADPAAYPELAQTYGSCR